MEQTAIDWLYEQLPIRIKNSYSKEIERAREIFKEQITNSYYHGTLDYDGSYSADDYFKDTFKTE